MAKTNDEYKYHCTGQIVEYDSQHNYNGEADLDEVDDIIDFFNSYSEDFSDTLNDLFDGNTITNIKWDYMYNCGTVGITVNSTRILTENEITELNDEIIELHSDEINCDLAEADFVSDDVELSMRSNITMQLVN